MAYLVRCVCSVELPDGSIVRCGAVRRIDPDPRCGEPGSGVGFPQYKCRCGSWVTAVPGDGGAIGTAHEAW